MKMKLPEQSVKAKLLGLLTNLHVHSYNPLNNKNIMECSQNENSQSISMLDMRNKSNNTTLEAKNFLKDRNTVGQARNELVYEDDDIVFESPFTERGIFTL